MHWAPLSSSLLLDLSTVLLLSFTVTIKFTATALCFLSSHPSFRWMATPNQATKNRSGPDLAGHIVEMEIIWSIQHKKTHWHWIVFCAQKQKKDYLSIYHLFFGRFISHISSCTKFNSQLLCVPLNSKCAAWINGLVLSNTPSQPWEFSLCASTCVFYELKKKNLEKTSMWFYMRAHSSSKTEQKGKNKPKQGTKAIKLDPELIWPVY